MHEDLAVEARHARLIGRPLELHLAPPITCMGGTWALSLETTKDSQLRAMIAPLRLRLCVSGKAFVCVLPDLPQSQQLWLKVCLG